MTQQFTSGYTPQRTESRVLKYCPPMFIQQIIHNCQTVEMTHVSMEGQLNKQNVV